MTPRIQLCATNNAEGKETLSSSSASSLWFQQEEGKKSAFVLDANGLEIEKPAEVVIQCVVEKSHSGIGDHQHQPEVVPFVLGGLEFISNSRNVEVYTSNPEGKETYMKTCRGIIVRDSQEENDEEYYKCVIVCNGGPQSVSRCRLKLLSLRPANCTRGKLQTIKLKGRLPNVSHEPEKDVATADTSRSKIPNLQPTTPSKASAPGPPQPRSQGLSQDDIGSAMAAVSMMVRVTEDRMVQKFQQGIQRVETLVGGGISGLEQSVSTLGALFVSQRQQLQQQQQLLIQQQEAIAAQNAILKELQENQIVLLGTVKSLQEQVDATTTTTGEAEQCGVVSETSVDEGEAKDTHSVEGNFRDDDPEEASEIVNVTHGTQLESVTGQKDQNLPKSSGDESANASANEQMDQETIGPIECSAEDEEERESVSDTIYIEHECRKTDDEAQDNDGVAAAPGETDIELHKDTTDTTSEEDVIEITNDEPQSEQKEGADAANNGQETAMHSSDVTDEQINRVAMNPVPEKHWSIENPWV